jgi:hypothetical protein
MNKATKLIFWQRITIGVLLLVSVFCMWQVHLYQIGRAADWQSIERLEDRLVEVYQSQNQNRLEDQNRITDLTLQVKSDQEMIATLGKGSVAKTPAHNSDDQKIIADLDKKLKRYEAKYGSLPREGEKNGTIVPDK